MAITRIPSRRPSTGVHAPKAAAVTPPRAGKVTETFKEGVTYPVWVGHRSIGGTAKLTKREGVYHLEMPVTFVGGIAFGTGNPKLSAAGGLPPLSKSYFSSGAKGIEQSPALKKRITEVAEQVEQLLSTDKFKLKIQPKFLADERPMLQTTDLLKPADRKKLLKEKGPAAVAEYETRGLVTALSNGASSQNARFKGNLPIIVTPLPDPNFITPTLWDVGTNPALLAHEVGHLIGIENEGFQLNGYPLDGIMNDETAFLALERVSPGTKPKLTDSDFNEMMQSLAGRVQTDPKPDPKVAQREFSPIPFDRYKTPGNSPRINWINLSYAERQRLTEQAVKQWLKR